MANKIKKGNIESYERADRYDDDGNKIKSYRVTVNGESFAIHLPDASDVYFEQNMEVVLLVNESNVAVAGVCPKRNFSWGDTDAIAGELTETDGFELATGTVQEKRKETFNTSRGTFASPAYYSQFRTTTTYTIVLPGRTFRVHETIGKQIKPGTQIVALLQNDIAFVVKDKTNNAIYGKPGKTYLIALFLWIAFNCVMYYMHYSGRQDVFTSFNLVLIIGNITFGIAFLFSFTAFLGASKSWKVFKQLSGQYN